jgi:hypothetical protein
MTDVIVTNGLVKRFEKIEAVAGISFISALSSARCARLSV